MTNNDQTKQIDARNSFTGKNLTASQFDESWAIAGVLEREIRKTGSFREKLTDYSHAFSRSEKFDQLRDETILRDMFKSRFGTTMNQMRESFMDREKLMADSNHEGALAQARTVKDLIKDGETMPFYRAYDRAAVEMAQKHSITETGAKTLMKDAFARAEGREFYVASKEVEKEYHEPVRQAERAEREPNQAQSKKRAPARHI